MAHCNSQIVFYCRWAVSGRSQMNREESRCDLTSDTIDLLGRRAMFVDHGCKMALLCSRQPRDSFQKQTDPSLGRHQTQRDNKPLRAYPGHVRREPSLPRPAAQNAPREQAAITSRNYSRHSFLFLGLSACSFSDAWKEFMSRCARPILFEDLLF